MSQPLGITSKPDRPPLRDRSDTASKEPAGGDGWQDSPAAKLDQLRASYRPDYNVGVRLGEPSLTESGYLHAIDLDIRVPDLADEAWDAFAALFPAYNNELAWNLADRVGFEPTVSLHPRRFSRP